MTERDFQSHVRAVAARVIARARAATPRPTPRLVRELDALLLVRGRCPLCTGPLDEARDLPGVWTCPGRTLFRWHERTAFIAPEAGPREARQ